MQTVKATILMLISVALLGACGLRGPLYLPTGNLDSPPPAEQDSTPVTDAEEDDEDTQKDTGKKAVSR